MIYHFTGNSQYLVFEQVLAWKNRFIEKYGDFNLLHIKNILDVDNNFLIESLTSQSFLSEKKLLIIDLEIGGKNIKNNEKQTLILSLLDKIPEENIVLFVTISPDKRSKIYKDLNKVSELKEFQSKNPDETFYILQKKFSGVIQDNALRKLILYKSNNIEKITSEIQKLLITKDTIDISDIEKYIYPELEESIFQFIDDVLSENMIGAYSKLEVILNNTNIYAFYNNLLANIRTQVFIGELKNNKIASHEIAQVLSLGNKKFLIDKRYKLSFKKLKILYIDLVYLDTKMKSGKLIGTDESDFRLEFENILLKIK
ncbi:MAG: hypothetical protein GY828_02180 [Candidatus Gracilibacteria bacterium]|nr:hypothetical protein [Candidatus Gracilibacteria bacterium]